MLQHLAPSVHHVMDLPREERIRHIQQGTWLPLDDTKKALEQMENMLSHPKVPRMPNLLLVGPSFSGKTTILNRFMDLHPPDMDPENSVTTCPVLLVESPPKPDISDFYSRILDATFAPFRHTVPAYQKYLQIKRLFRDMGVRMLMIDEIHHLIAGGANRQKEFRNAIKSMGNEMGVSIVVAGIDDAYNALNLDPQMASRFPPLALTSRWHGEDSQRLLMTLEMRLPLAKPSDLSSEALSQRIASMAEGSLGNICDLCKFASIDAIRSGTEQITLDQIMKLNWVPPSARRKHRPVL
jgi:uncharacterized protein with GYD domain